MDKKYVARYFIMFAGIIFIGFGGFFASEYYDIEMAVYSPVVALMWVAIMYLWINQSRLSDRNRTGGKKIGKKARNKKSKPAKN